MNPELPDNPAGGRTPAHYGRALWRLTRPHTLTASFVPVAIGTGLALAAAEIDLTLFSAMLAASLLIQAATNIFNEYFDYTRGLDSAASVGIAGAIVRDGLSARAVFWLGIGTVGLAILLGLYICLRTTWWLLPLGLACTAVGYLYSGGPLPLSATPFGELVSGGCMGLVIISIAYYIQTGQITALCLLASVPTSLLIGAILMANNIRDREGDALHGRKTLAILLGRRHAIRCLAGIFATAYLWLILLTWFGQLTPWSLIALAALPWSYRAVNGFLSSSSTLPAAQMPAMVATAQTNTVFGLGLALGLLIAHYWTM